MKFFQQEFISPSTPYEKLLNFIQHRMEKEQDWPHLAVKTDINFPDFKGYSLLHYAILEGDLKKVLFCLEKGADMNLKSPEGLPILLAMNEKHLNIADYLFKKGAKCSQINSYDIVPFDSRTWFNQLAKKALTVSFPNPAKGLTFSKEKNNFFDEGMGLNSISSMVRAVQIGDFDFVKTGLNNKNKPDKCVLLIEAVKSGLFEMIKFLIEKGALINPNRVYTETPLLAAIQYQHSLIIDYLMENKANLEVLDNRKKSCLFYAVYTKNMALIDQLLKRKIDYKTKDCDGNTLLHVAMMQSDNKDIIERLLKEEDMEALLTQKNIYGVLPVDWSTQYHEKKHVVIAQISLIKNLKYYMMLNNRGWEFLEDGGLCNGFSFLFLFYCSRGKKDYYFDTLSLISRWDGTEAALKASLKDTPQGAFYENLGQLFEGWLNDIIWFQHSSLNKLQLKLEQHQHREHYEMIQDKSESALHVLYKETSALYVNRVYRNLSHIQEILTYIQTMPRFVQVVFTGGEHATAGYFDEKNHFIYYDPNFRLETAQTNLIGHIQRLIDYKLILCDVLEKPGNCTIQIFYFAQDLNPQALDAFEVIPEKDLPSTPTEAIEFQKNSPNSYTPLHIAVLTRCITTFKKLLERNVCDIQARDHTQSTILDMIIENQFDAALKLLLKKDPIDTERLNNLVYKSYEKWGYSNTLKIILKTQYFTDFAGLCCLALQKYDFELMYSLFQEKSSRLLEEDYELMMKTILRLLPQTSTEYQFQEEMIHLIMKQGFQVTNLKQGNSILKYVIEHEPNLFPIFLSYLKDLDLPIDVEGYTALHLAIQSQNDSILKTLLESKADLHAKISGHEPISDIIADVIYNNKLWFFNHNKFAGCLSYLLSLDHFQLFKNQPLSFNYTVAKYILDYQNEALFKKILEIYPKEDLDRAPGNELNLFFSALIQGNVEKMQLLLAAGADINAQTKNKQYTPIMILVQSLNIPNRLEMLNILLENHPDLSLVNCDNKTVFDFLRESNEEALIECFKKHGYEGFPEKGFRN